MASLPRWGSEFVLSPDNLNAFQDWFLTQAPDVQLAHSELFVIEHANTLLLVFVRKLPPVIQWDQEGPLITQMKTRDCVIHDCHRCTSGIGGYVFRWIGPWTCMEAVTLAERIGFGPENRLAFEKVWSTRDKCNFCSVRQRNMRAMVTAARFVRGQTSPQIAVDPNDIGTGG